LIRWLTVFELWPRWPARDSWSRMSALGGISAYRGFRAAAFRVSVPAAAT
jgi:hypothetical protein